MKSGRPRGPGKALQNVGGFAPHIFEGFPGPAGPARPQKRTPKNPARLPSGTQTNSQAMYTQILRIRIRYRCVCVFEIIAARDPTNAHGFAAVDVTKPDRFTWLGDIHGTHSCEYTGSRATIISHTPVPTERTEHEGRRLDIHQRQKSKFVQGCPPYMYVKTAQAT